MEIKTIKSKIEKSLESKKLMLREIKEKHSAGLVESISEANIIMQLLEMNIDELSRIKEDLEKVKK